MQVQMLTSICAPFVLAAAPAAWASTGSTAAPAPEPIPQVLEVATLEPVNVQLGYHDSDRQVFEIHYPHSADIKLRFDRFELAAGDFVTVSNPAGTEVYTYYSDPTTRPLAKNSYHTLDPNGEGRFWAMSVEGDTAIVQLHRQHPDKRYNRQSRPAGIEITTLYRGYTESELHLYNLEESERRSICGRTDFKDSECFKDSHPEVYERSRAVARLRMGGGLCTAWRIGSANHMLTNNHCMSSQREVSGSEVQFNYRNSGCGTGSNDQIIKVPGETFIKASGSGSMDMCLFTIAQEATADHGYLVPTDRELQSGEEIYILQHPSGDPQQIAVESDSDSGGLCKGGNPGGRLPYKCDTEGGSSGSPVLRASDHQVVALHNLGGCPNGSNSGVNFWDVWKLIEDDVPLASVEVAGPLAGEELERGSEYAIDWLASGVEQIVLKLNKGGIEDSELMPATDATPGMGSYTWQISETQALGDDYQVSIVNAPDGTVTGESGVFSIIAPGLVEDGYPYIQPFEDFTPGDAQFSDGMWRQETREDDINWVVQAGTADLDMGETAGKTGPSADHTSGDETGKYVYVEASGDNYPAKLAQLVTPYFDLKDLEEPELSFWYHMHSDNEGTDEMGELALDLRVGDDWSAGEVELSMDQGEDWQQVFLDLSDAAGERIRLRFRATTGSGWASDIAIDDFVINDRPAFLSEPETEALEDDKYKYEIEVRDDDPSMLKFELVEAPKFLKLKDNGDGTAELTGKPDKDDSGEHEIIIEVSDGLIAEPIHQEFTIEVEALPEEEEDEEDADDESPGDGGDESETGWDGIDDAATGCGCRSTGGGAPLWSGVLLFGLAAGLRRRR